MNFISRMFSSPEEKASRAYALHVSSLPAAVWSARNYQSFVKEGYNINVVAFQAIRRLAEAVSSIQWEAWKEDKKLDKHPYLDLIRNPNPSQTGHDWWRARVSYLYLSGTIFDERVLLGKAPKELWVLRPDRMKIVLGRTGLPREYIYSTGNNKQSFAADPVTGVSDIHYTHFFDPLDEMKGLSPINAAAFGIDQHNEAMKWLQRLLQNSARPSGALIVDKDMNLSDDEFARLKRELEVNHQGAENAGRPLLLEGGLDWKAMGLSPIDMEVLKVKDSAARDISLAFGVPPLLLNIPGDNTYANYREARLGFYEDTVIPLVRYIVKGMNNWLSPSFGDVELRPNIDAIEAVADKRQKLWEMADDSQELTVNERRALKGYSPLSAPLGDMLMSELNASRKADKDAQSEDVKKTILEAAYGRNG